MRQVWMNTRWDSKLDTGIQMESGSSIMESISIASMIWYFSGVAGVIALIAFR